MLCRDEVVPGGALTVAEYIIYFLNQRDKSRESYRTYYDVPRDVPTDVALELYPYVTAKFGKKDDSSCAKYSFIPSLPPTLDLDHFHSHSVLHSFLISSFHCPFW